jgi:hypothetical protein
MVRCFWPSPATHQEMNILYIPRTRTYTHTNTCIPGSSVPTDTDGSMLLAFSSITSRTCIRTQLFPSSRDECIIFVRTRTCTYKDTRIPVSCAPTHAGGPFYSFRSFWPSPAPTLQSVSLFLAKHFLLHLRLHNMRVRQCMYVCISICIHTHMHTCIHA